MQIRYRLIGFSFAALSLLLIIWQHYGMTRVLRIDSSWPYLQAIDDRGEGGGTVSRLSISEDGVRVDCDLTLDYMWAFCELAIYMQGDGLTGLDLTGYDSMVIAADYTHPGVDRIRVMIRNFNPAYSDRTQFTTLKVNEIDYQPSTNPVLSIPLSHFQVASWWRQSMSLPIDYIASEFSEVIQIDITTGGAVVPGKYSITLKYLEFRGKWISAVALYRALLIGWLLFALFAVVLELQHYRRRLRASQQREVELQSMNHLLELQSEKFEKLASHDPLTGIRNRAGIRDRFLEHIYHARYGGKPLAGIFIDIDHFKSINDSGGHQLGDQVLVEFTELISSHIRDRDLFARWGGEEFLLLCPNTSLRDASILAEKLRELVAEQNWSNGVRISASFGVTVFDDEDVALFIGRADTALYRAKSEGRNRVVTLAANRQQVYLSTAE